MADNLHVFLEAAARKSSDKEHLRKLNFNIARYDSTVVLGKQQYAGLELARRRAKNAKWKALENLDKMLVSFEAAFTSRGGKVIWARDAEEARVEILKILQNASVTSVVKAKSMTTEELHLNEALEREGIEAVETDLGEFIVQLAGEAPYHIVTPAMHKSKEDVAKLFHEKFGTPPDATPEFLTGVAREKLRRKYLTAGAGISGANFLIADTGAVAVTENEGNARLSTSFPRIHIAVAGIEKIIPSLSDLSHFWPLLATYGTGQKLTVYNTLFTGPRREGEPDGPEEMYVVLLDNGRTELLARPEQREALYCIRCGACLNACPVYRNVGGHTYGTTYTGPIGSVISPHLRSMQSYGHLSFASSLCGKCSEVCPVHIDLHHLLLYNRRDAVQAGFASGSERLAMKLWLMVTLNRRWMNFPGGRVKQFFFRLFLSRLWGRDRELPEIAPESFNSQWNKKNKR